MKYQYKMVQVPPSISIRSKDYKGGEAAGYLEEIVTQWSQLGWEFYRVDAIGVQIQAGCLASLFGQSAQERTYYVITFRMPSSSPPPLSQSE
jgi:hypothetical protein